MKKFIPLIIIPLIIWPVVCFSSYLIELNNGSKFIIYQYWEKGNLIKFYYYGGVVGIHKNLIKKIEKTNLVCEDQVYLEETIIQNAVQKPQPRGQKADKTDNDLVDIKYYKREKQRLEQELDEAKQRYLSSLEKGDKETKHAASRDALKINIQIDQVKKELKEKNKGILPEWWNK